MLRDDGKQSGELLQRLDPQNQFANRFGRQLRHELDNLAMMPRAQTHVLSILLRAVKQRLLRRQSQ